MYLEEIDGIIYIDNLPSLSPNMEVSFIKTNFQYFLRLYKYSLPPWNYIQLILTFLGWGFKTNQQYI